MYGDSYEKDLRDVMARLAVLEDQSKKMRNWCAIKENRIRSLENFQLKVVAYASLAVIVSGWLFQKFA